jgi:hypothetical protein
MPLFAIGFFIFPALSWALAALAIQNAEFCSLDSIDTTASNHYPIDCSFRVCGSTDKYSVIGWPVGAFDLRPANPVCGLG